MGLFGSDDSGFASARESQKRIKQLYDQVKDPTYAEMVPELYDSESMTGKLIDEDPVTKSLQQQALQRMAGLAERGETEQDAAGFANARSMGDQFARGNTQAALQDAQNRGVAGSGMEFAMREMANQGGAERARSSALDQAASSARQRALYAQAYGQQLGQSRDQNYRAGAANTDIINRFNQANTQNRNNVAMANVDKRTDSFKYNEGIKDKNYNNQMGRADRLAGNFQRDAEIDSAESEAERKRRAAQGSAIGTAAGSFFGPAGAAAGGAIGGSIA